MKIGQRAPAVGVSVDNTHVGKEHTTEDTRAALATEGLRSTIACFMYLSILWIIVLCKNGKKIEEGEDKRRKTSPWNRNATLPR